MIHGALHSDSQSVVEGLPRISGGLVALGAEGAPASSPVAFGGAVVWEADALEAVPTRDPVGLTTPPLGNRHALSPQTGPWISGSRQ